MKVFETKKYLFLLTGVFLLIIFCTYTYSGAYNIYDLELAEESCDLINITHAGPVNEISDTLSVPFKKLESIVSGFIEKDLIRIIVFHYTLPSPLLVRVLSIVFPNSIC